MKMHLVIGNTDYEGFTTIRAFKSKARAKALCDRCVLHEAKKPEPPGTIENTPENDAEFEAWDLKLKRWAKRHPAGAHHALSRYSYEIIDLDYDPTC